jgi:hypothetical protein
MDEALQRALWEGDIDKLGELAGCICCCDEHTFEHCPARQWEGCRGQGTMTRAEEEAWAEFYWKHHGLTKRQFYGDAPYGGELLTEDEQIAVDLLSEDLGDLDVEEVPRSTQLRKLVPDEVRRARLALLVRIGP